MPNLGGYFSVVAADLNVVGIDVQFPMVVLRRCIFYIPELDMISEPPTLP